jgi:hypothetical protein
MMSGYVQRTIEPNTRLTTNWNTVDQVDDETRDDSRDDVNQVGITTINQEKFLSDSNLAEKNVEQDSNHPSYINRFFGLFKTQLSQFLDNLSQGDFDASNKYTQSLCVMKMIQSPVINDDQSLKLIRQAIKQNFKEINFDSIINSLSFDDVFLSQGQIRVEDFMWYTNLDQIILFFNTVKNIFDELNLNFPFTINFPELPENLEIVTKECVMDQLTKFPFEYTTKQPF